jgi:hypothetical protein
LLLVAVVVVDGQVAAVALADCVPAPMLLHPETHTLLQLEEEEPERQPIPL